MKTTDYRGMTTSDRKNRKFPEQITSEAKQYMIISDIAKGMTYTEIVNKYVNEWGLGLKTVQNYVVEAVAYMRSDAAKESLIAMNLERLDNLYSESVKEKDRKNALKAIDTINKMSGAYTERVKIEGDSDITLNFQM